jgi:ubiquinone/menaquinone biosynthesis C-methylase UbiE
MKAEAVQSYRAPGRGDALTLEAPQMAGPEVVSGALVAADGTRFPISNGIPDLTWPQTLQARERRVIEFYDGRAGVYDQNLPLTFTTHGEDEATVRETMVDALEIKPGDRVLEVGAGTGRDSEIIARRLDGTGELFCQDLARSMLERNRTRLAGLGLKAEFSVGNASFLPFPDNYFDSVYQFGGIGEFPDIAGFLREVVRVTRAGGRVVVGDESMPPWLRETDFAKILTFTNPQFNAPLPLEHVPVEARQVRLRWIIGGTFYLLDFTVGEGEPTADIDFPIPGPRGGTHRSRYWGQLEGVTPATKALALQARAKLGISMHDWLEDIVRREAEKQLGMRNEDA